MKYPKGTHVKLKTTSGLYDKDIYEIVDYDPFDYTYELYHILYGYKEWRKEDQFTVVKDTKLPNDYYMQPIFYDSSSGWKPSKLSKKCSHRWKGTTLIYTTVFDCELCGMKKEDHESESKIDWEVPF